jgi:antitoxin (DNA-binding transcriptional repressor) of toxin-antitoxin stability system
MQRIDQTQFFADPASALERARANGETLEIIADGRTIARLVPEPTSDPVKRAQVEPGGSRHVMALRVPGATLEDLWTADDSAEWEPKDDKFS